ncbi:MAG TPA: hypothetical protein VI837_02020 [Blastocatellia bacterium]|nr:hypothetical protein [Blastocatellia bacterium]
MKLNGDEKRIQQLFSEMSLDDRRRTPEFVTVLAAANSGIAHSQNRARSLRFTMAVAIVCVALLIAMAVIVKPSKPKGPVVHDAQALAPTVPPESPPSVGPSRTGVEAPGVELHKVAKKHGRHRRRSNQFEIAMKSLFAWKSPTASLLQTPADELLRSLPRLGESLRTIRFFSPDEFN